MKNVLKLIVVMAVLSVFVAGACCAAADAPTVYVDGVLLEFDVEPVIIEGRTLVPFRKLFETFGFSIEWDDATKTISSVRSAQSGETDTTIVVEIGNPDAHINGQVYRLDVAPLIIEDRTMMPLRFVAEASGADVKWDGDTKTITISTSVSDESFTAHIETMGEGGTEIEYVVLSGLADSALQDELNERIQTFFAWPLVDISAPDKIVASTAQYTILGKYICIMTTGTEYVESAAHPVNFVDTIMFDVETGGAAWSFSDFVNVGSELRDAINSGAFVQIYPDLPIEGAAEVLASEIIDNVREDYTRFYLTKDSVIVYVPERLHAEGDYWAFEAKYSQIEPLLTQKLLDLIDIQETADIDPDTDPAIVAARDVLFKQFGDESGETGYNYHFMFEEMYMHEGQLCYKFRMMWLVDGSHWSSLGFVGVTPDGQVFDIE